MKLNGKGIHYFFILGTVVTMTFACSKESKKFDEQAHRGGRGLMPENTIMSQKLAIDYGTTMEMDLQMTKDKKIVVSHDAFLNHLFVLTPEGDTMSSKEGRSRLIYNMTYDSLVQYDVGSKPHPDFPDQKNISAVRPLLSELIDSVEAYASQKNHTNHYNIEIKSSEKADGVHYPSVEEFVDSVMSIINQKNIGARTMIQSFDTRALNRVHEKWPDIRISYLVGADNDQDVQGYIEELGFKPDIFSPNYKLCTPEWVGSFHKEGIKIIPWTPNTVEEMQELKDMGVDGIITDYPNYFSELN